MSEPIPAEIWIGGKIPRRLVPELCEAITGQGLSLEDEGTFEPETAEDLLSQRRDDGLLCLYDCQANYGEFPVLEGFLVEAEIAFRRKTEPCWDSNASVVEFRPGMEPLYYQSDVAGEPIIAIKEFAAIAKAVDQATSTAEDQTKLELLRRLRNLQELVHERLPKLAPPLEPFEIVD